ncbi:MAG: hypothetical protein C0616_03500 [Desulfuromonas sp.]|nr:MAG: hypothetical protein C0616_03500 [Desulfuromonas sp.]
MNLVYECRSCGVISQEEGHLCQPQRLENMGVYCGTQKENVQMCTEMKQHLTHVCGSCGRPAEQADMVCDPKFPG